MAEIRMTPRTATSTGPTTTVGDAGKSLLLLKFNDDLAAAFVAAAIKQAMKAKGD